MSVKVRVIAVLTFILFLEGCYSSKNKTSLTITFVGDLLLDRGVRERIENLGIDYLFDPSIDSLFCCSDMVVANLECPVTKIHEPINKKYIFRAEPKYLGFLKQHGITHLNMANNHSMDQGRNGLIDTYTNIISVGLTPTGYGVNYSEACQPLLISKYPRRVYLLSSLQVPSENWIFTKDKSCICEASIGELSNYIRAIREQYPLSVILVQLHWGVEHTFKPMISQKQQAHEIIDAGADAIIGHHSHTIQTVEYYKGKPIYYGIGNFIFDQSKPMNSKGLAVKVQIKEEQIDFLQLEFMIDKCCPHLITNHVIEKMPQV